MPLDLSSKRTAAFLLPVLPCLIPLVAGVSLVAWRPWVLGFYHDDWWTIARPVEGPFFTDFTEQASRPLYFVLITSLRYLLPTTPLPWHILLACFVMLNAVLIGCVGRRLALVMSALSTSAQWAGCLGATVWLCSPWDLGATAWVTPAVGQIAIALFCLASLVLLSERRIGQKLILGGGFLALAYLINELFWLAFVPVLFVVAVRDLLRKGASSLQPLFMLLAGLLVVQALPIALNRALAFFEIGINRSFNTKWIDVVILSFRLLPAEISRAVVVPGAFWALCAALGLSWLASLAVMVRREQSSSALLILAGFGAIVAGCAGSVILFALAGYRVESIGVFSRSFITFSVWASWLPAVFLAAADRLPQAAMRAALAVWLALIVVMGASTFARLDEWRTAWQGEQAMISAIPLGEIERQARSGSFIVILVPEHAGSVESLEAYWDATGMLTSRAPGLAARINGPKARMFATAAHLSKHRVSWNGTKMTMTWCAPQSGELWSLKAEANLIVWDAVHASLSVYDDPVEFGCGIDPPRAM